MQIIDSFQNRLSLAMKERNIKQVDLVEKTKLDKTLINKYLAGVSNARQRKLTILADALNVNEVWLMGYDVPMEREFKMKDNLTFYGNPSMNTLQDEIQEKYGKSAVEHLENYSKLNDLGKQTADIYVESLTEVPKYTVRKNVSQKEQTM